MTYIKLNIDQYYLFSDIYLDSAWRYGWMAYIINSTSTWTSKGGGFLYLVNLCGFMAFNTNFYSFICQANLLVIDEKYPHIVYVQGEKVGDEIHNDASSVNGDQAIDLEGIFFFLFFLIFFNFVKYCFLVILYFLVVGHDDIYYMLGRGVLHVGLLFFRLDICCSDWLLVGLSSSRTFR